MPKFTVIGASNIYTQKKKKEFHVKQQKVDIYYHLLDFFATRTNECNTKMLKIARKFMIDPQETSYGTPTFPMCIIYNQEPALRRFHMQILTQNS